MTITQTPATEGTERLTSETFAVEHKKFFLDLHQNHRGQFIRITEDTNGRRDRILVPSCALREMVSALNRIIAFTETHYTQGES